MTYRTSDVSVAFGDVQALQSVTVSVAPGQVVAVVGGDGAGKTTLLRAVVGEVPVQWGEVVVPPAEHMGYLPASTGSWLELTVQENMDFVGGVFGLRGSQLRRRTDDLLARAGLDAARDRLSSQLSGGMRRKLGFCLAMISSPQLLVLDEPSTGVDPVSRVDLWRLVSQAAASGAAVLMSTTYLDEAERAEHILVLDRGRTILAGAPEDVLADFGAVITTTAQPRRREWAWRRGNTFHEFWPVGASPSGESVRPDLEDVVIAAALLNRSAGEVRS
jgi:ABC-2 type transport system ATP-binding protein